MRRAEGRFSSRRSCGTPGSTPVIALATRAPGSSRASRIRSICSSSTERQARIAPDMSMAPLAVGVASAETSVVATASGAERFPHLFSPLELRGHVLRNRIVSTPHATGWGTDGLIDPREVEYHVRKAAGGCGLVMTFGSASVDPASEASYGSISLWDERNEPALRALADGVHRHGAICMSQMTHMGRRGTSTITGIPLRSASDLPEGVHLEVPVPLAVSEIPAIVQRFAEAARRLEACGWDGCEVTSFGGHLIEQFFDPQVNERTDEYGGSLDNRTRFGREVLEAVRAAVSDDFIVGFRMTADQCLTGGPWPADRDPEARNLPTNGAHHGFSVSRGSGATRRS